MLMVISGYAMIVMEIAKRAALEETGIWRYLFETAWAAGGIQLLCVYLWSRSLTAEGTPNGRAEIVQYLRPYSWSGAIAGLVIAIVLDLLS